MKKEDFKNRNAQDLTDILKEKRNLLRDFRFRVARGRAKNTKEGRDLKKQIAQILTEINKLEAVSNKQ